MTFLKIKTLANLPSQSDIDYTKIGEFISVISGIVVAFWKWCDKYFDSKKQEKQEFIANVVKATIESSLSEYNSEFQSFKKEMRQEVAHFNETVIKIYAEIAKK